MKYLKQKRKVSFYFTDENATTKTTIERTLSSKIHQINQLHDENDKENNVEKPLIEADKSDSCSDDDLNRTYIISSPVSPATSPRTPQSSPRISRQTSLTKKSPIRPCKHRILLEDGACQRCKIVVGKSKMYSPMKAPKNVEKLFTINAPERIASPAGKSEAITSLPWPLPSRKALAPFVFVNPAKGRFIIQKDTELIFEAVDREAKSAEYFVKYIFRVSKDDLQQVVTVFTPSKANQTVPDEKAALIPPSSINGEFTDLQQLDLHFPGCYKNICRALKIISGRVPRIECRNILEIKHLYARIMINGDFRLIFPDNRIFFQKFGTSPDTIESPKGAEYSMTEEERNIFDKARSHLHELDEVHRKTNGPNYYGIVVHVCMKSEKESIICNNFKSSTI